MWMTGEPYSDEEILRAVRGDAAAICAKTKIRPSRSRGISIGFNRQETMPGRAGFIRRDQTSVARFAADLRGYLQTSTNKRYASAWRRPADRRRSRCFSAAMSRCIDKRSSRRPKADAE